MFVRCLRSFFPARRFFCSSPGSGFPFLSTAETEAAKPSNTEVSAQNTDSSKPASTVDDTLIRRLFRIRTPDFGSAATVIAKWKEEKGVVSKPEFLSAIRELIGQHRYADALTVRDSMLDVKDFELNSVDYASHIGLIFKVHGLQSTEKFFDGIPEEMKDGITSAALLQIFVTAGETTKAEALMEKMKESGFMTTYHPYIHMLSLYLSKKQFVKAEETVTKLKKVIPPDVRIYNMWISACASGKDVEGAERAFAHMKEAKVQANWQTHATLADLYFEKKLFEKAGVAMKEMENVAPSPPGRSPDNPEKDRMRVRMSVSERVRMQVRKALRDDFPARRFRTTSTRVPRNRMQMEVLAKYPSCVISYRTGRAVVCCIRGI